MTTIQQITTYLAQRGWQYSLDIEHNRIITGVKSEILEKLLILIKLSEDNEYFEITIPELLTGLKNHPHQGIVFKTMLSLTSETKMLRWEYEDLADQVHAKIEIPLEDAQLTQKQFDRCLEALIEIVEIAIPRLLTIMETGEDPATTGLGERLLLKLEQLLPEGYLNLLDQALTNRKNRGIFLTGA